jgi:4-hydroxybenzoate polyprenyltransferase/phosphoserine phosphatase
MTAERVAPVPSEGVSADAEDRIPADENAIPFASPENGLAASTTLPLCVDLDGTLVKSDTLMDSICILARANPASLVRLPLWLRHGKAAFKQAVTAQALLDAAHLPYNEPLLIYLREQAAAGRPIFLSTGADHALAERVSQHLGIFDAMFASDGRNNLTGPRKLQLLEDYFGRGGFGYIGNSGADLPLLAASADAMLANPNPGLRARLKHRGIRVQNTFQDRAPVAQSFGWALRLHQWAKNVLIFLPLLLAHAAGLATLLHSVLAFFSFSLVASSTYIVNDLLDLASDRSHPTKRQRPFAAGDLSALSGILLSTALFAGGVLLARPLAGAFTAWLLIYCGVTLAYSLYFKRIVIVDVIILSALYTLRILAGAAAARVPISDWMAGFAIFFFFSLALVKRFSELENLRARGTAPTNGRGYLVHDMEQLRAFGTASAFASIVVFSLYINNPDVRNLYHHPQRLWLLTPLLIWWLSRVWLRASRGQMQEDPVVFALTDRASLLAGVVIFVIALSAAL